MDEMEPVDLPPLPPIKKHKHRAGGRSAMNRSRSFVAEMFHIEQQKSPHKKWSTNDMQMLEKLGISPKNDTERNRLQISPNLHPDLKEHAFQDQINSLSQELSSTKNNLRRAAEYGQHLIEQNSKMESSVVELRNEAAEYIAQILELREENERFKVRIESNEYSVNEYQNKMHEIKNDKEDLNDVVMNLKNELSDIRIKYEIEQSKCKLYENENKEYQLNADKLNDKTAKEMSELRTNLLILQNTNHSLSMERDELRKEHENILQKHRELENEYNAICNEYNKTEDESHRFIISRRRSHSHSRSHSKSNKREDLEEKMDEKAPSNESETDDNEHNEYAKVLMQCMDLFEDILDNQHIHSPIKQLKSNDNISVNTNDRVYVDVELFKDLMKSVRDKLKDDRYGVVNKRDLAELPRNLNSKSNPHFMETLDSYIDRSLSMDDDDDNVGVDDDDNEHKKYEADNEDLDNLPNKAMVIEPIDDKQRECVEQFLVRYSENDSWNKWIGNGDNDCEYELEIEFNENINLKNKKDNNISITSSLLQSLTNLIENMMGINDKSVKSNTFSICGWFCGKVSTRNEDYSQHYLNILSSLDYNKENRNEIYWVIYQLLSIIYKYYNHKTKVSANNELNDDDNNYINYKSSSESTISSSMMFNQTKTSKYAELKPHQRRKTIKNALKNKMKSRGTFHAVVNSSSSDDDDDS